MTAPAGRAGGKRGPPRGCRLSQTAGGLRAAPGPAARTGREPCAVLVASFAAPGGFLWLLRRGSWSWAGRSSTGPCSGLGGKGEGQLPGTRGQRGGSARSSSLSLSSPVTAPLHFLRLPGCPPPPCKRATLGAVRHRPRPSPVSASCPPCTHSPGPAPGPTRATASTRPRADERTENTEPLGGSPPVP